MLSISIMVTTIPEVSSRCGCHGIPGPGFFAQNRQQNHNFDALPQPGNGGGGGGGGGWCYLIFILFYFIKKKNSFNPHQSKCSFFSGSS